MDFPLGPLGILILAVFLILMRLSVRLYKALVLLFNDWNMSGIKFNSLGSAADFIAQLIFPDCLVNIKFRPSDSDDYWVLNKAYKRHKIMSLNKELKLPKPSKLGSSTKLIDEINNIPDKFEE